MPFGRVWTSLWLLYNFAFCFKILLNLVQNSWPRAISDSTEIAIKLRAPQTIGSIQGPFRLLHFKAFKALSDLRRISFEARRALSDTLSSQKWGRCLVLSVMWCTYTFYGVRWTQGMEPGVSLILAWASEARGEDGRTKTWESRTLGRYPPELQFSFVNSRITTSAFSNAFKIKWRQSKKKWNLG